MNPVARRELQERFRTMRSPMVLSVWVFAIGAVTFLAYLFASARADERLEDFGRAGIAGFGSVVASSSMGQFILHALLLGLLTAVVFVVPGQAAVTIVGERERQTLELLQVSQMSAWGIVVGKLLSSIAFILLLLVASMPLLVIPVLLGGVTIADVIGGVGMVMAAAVMVGAVSMWTSARAKSTQGAVLGSYVWTVALMLGTLALVVAELLLIAPDEPGGRNIQSGIVRTDGYEVYSAWFNPYLGMIDASTDVLEFGPEIVGSPYGPLRSVLTARQGVAAGVADAQYDPFDQLTVGNAGGFDDFSRVSVGARQFTTRELEPIRGAVWWRTLLFEAVITVLTLLAATRLVRVPRRRMRLLQRRTANGS
jgi:ABC-type transport system involved in multi-copper enzyme maturation permease subunit